VTSDQTTWCSLYN